MVMVSPHLTSRVFTGLLTLGFVLIKKQLRQSHKILSLATGKQPDITQVLLRLLIKRLNNLKLFERNQLGQRK